VTACTPGSAPGPTLGNEYVKREFYVWVVEWFDWCAQRGGSCVSAKEEGVHRVSGDARDGAGESEPRTHPRVQVSARTLQSVQPQCGGLARSRLIARVTATLPAARSF